ncbi:hypothetical protein ACFLUT_01025 [Chloroflexota bacterium]
MNDKNTARETADYETYLEERRALVGAELDQARQFDRHILYLAAGSFGLSLLFVQRFGSDLSGCAVAFLLLGWMAFCASIGCTLTSFLVSTAALKRQRELLDEWLDEAENKRATADSKQNPLAHTVTVLNVASLVLFLLGAGSLIGFAIANLVT